MSDNHQEIAHIKGLVEYLSEFTDDIIKKGLKGPIDTWSGKRFIAVPKHHLREIKLQLEDIKETLERLK